MQKTLLQKLKEYDKTMLPMHMPGHKRNLSLSGKDGYLAALCADCDITEIEGFDNLAEPEGVLLSLKKRAANLWKSEEAYPLVNGSTGGILAGIYATVPQGGSVIVARNCHKSVYNGLQLVNAKVSYLMPEWDAEIGCYGSISPALVEEALKKEPDAKLIIVSSPTYEGVLSDIEGICRVAHAYGVPVLVDSAHGAHLGFFGFPKSAIECGADIVVQSLHKTLPCLTQTAMLHRTGRLVSGEELQAAVNLFQTSSPSYLLLASVDGCIGLLEEQGKELFHGWRKALETFYTDVRELHYISVVEGDLFGAADGDDSIERELFFLREPGKIIISTTGANITGPELMKQLREEYHIESEMAAEQYVIAMTGLGDTKESLLHLAQAIKEIDANCKSALRKEMIGPTEPKVYWSIGEAMGKTSEEVCIQAAVGRMAAEHLWAYPPGIPVIVAGEEITKETVEYLSEKKRRGVEIHRKGGVCNGELRIRVVSGK